MAPPLGPSFVYGVGSIGFQHCPACGARWRCMWPTERRRRVPRRTLALVGAIALALGAGIAAYASTRSVKGPELAASTRGAGGRQPASGKPVSPAGARYLALAGPSNAVRTDLMQFLNAAPPVTPVAELEQHVAMYAAAARRADAALTTGRWPAAASPAIQQLVTADRTLADDLRHGAGRLNQRSVGDHLERDATAVRAAAARVRTALGIPAIAPLSDPRFALL